MSDWPLSLTVTPIAAMLNFELADHPIYDGAELQWFDDDEHGRGMLAFLSRREGRCVDYYVDRELRLDKAGYHLGGGTRSWNETDFEVARLDVAEDGVDAEARFKDVDGRQIEIRICDRDGRRRRPAGLLAPFGSGIDEPVSLPLVWMPRFDLVRVTKTPPVIRIDGTLATTGRLPGARLHKRCLIKYAAPLVAVDLNQTGDHDSRLERGQKTEVDGAGRLTRLTATKARHEARVVLQPGMPEPAGIQAGHLALGRWHVEVDGVRLTGGTWRVRRSTASSAQVEMDVDERWRPGRLPWLMRVVTTVVPVFRRWPTTYRWFCTVDLDGVPRSRSRWQRTGSGPDRSYRRVTRS
ncbi:MAG TPA: hypothetical protein VFX33_06630 [Actinomycetales bacterium]|nr:hypothetical protein [Actinomycetales bacterium]